MNIGQRIKNRREELCMTQQELANKMNYKSKTTINKIENGVNDVRQNMIVEFAKVLDVTPSYLMGWESDPTTPMGALSIEYDRGHSIESIAAQDVELLSLFHRLEDKNKEVVIKMITTLLESQD